MMVPLQWWGASVHSKIVITIIMEFTHQIGSEGALWIGLSEKRGVCRGGCHCLLLLPRHLHLHHPSFLRQASQPN